MANQQQVVWIDGASGSGKTSLAQALKEQGWIAFEGDAFFTGADPVGEIEHAPKEQSEQIKQWTKDMSAYFFALWGGRVPDVDLKERVTVGYDTMCSAVLEVCQNNPETNVVISRAVYSNDLRARVTETLGPNLKWVFLTASNECLGARIEARFTEQGAGLGKTLEEFIGTWPAEMFPDGEDRVEYLRRSWWQSSMMGFDPPLSESTFSIHVDDSTSKDDVKQKAFESLGLAS
eukprot:TRINITY_DN52630_c0_g1_i1.p1 TRINITY_DN52630_c0_g1~~TRINITY_DN52630_c0_g1_i1.p1  ORF type:complete len:233 (+),score=39.51 TRINITY_DN52630_c0_g1_i1:36-734(+)